MWASPLIIVSPNRSDHGFGYDSWAHSATDDSGMQEGKRPSALVFFAVGLFKAGK